MSPIIVFILAIVSILGCWWAWSANRFGFRYDPSIIKGIVLAVAFALLLGGASYALSEEPELEWFADAYVFAGLDYTKKASPVCDSSLGGDDHSTSNIRYQANLVKYGPFRTDWKYTHHSCAFGEDDRQYDAFFGASVMWQLW